MSLLRKFRGKDGFIFLSPQIDPFIIDNFLLNDSFSNQNRFSDGKYIQTPFIMRIFTPHTVSNETKALQAILKIDPKNKHYGLIFIKHFRWIHDQNNCLSKTINNISFDFATKMVDFFKLDP